MEPQFQQRNGRPVYVVDGSRTPFIKVRGRPGPFRASDLAFNAARPLLARQSFAPDEIDEVIFGCIAPGPDEVNIARVIALRLGCGDEMPAWTVQRNCGSGMQALDSAAKDIAIGRADLVLAGGTESMSHAPVLFDVSMVDWLGQWTTARSFSARIQSLFRFRPGYLKPVIGLLRGLTDPICGLSMGQTAEELAHRFGISREAMDEYAVESHKRLAAAHDEGRMSEVEVVYDWRGNSYARDDGVRPDSSVESLAKLKPAFDREFGNVTAGNSAQITDGAACLILASEDAVRRHQLTIMGGIVDTQWAALDPRHMGLGPVYASTRLLRGHGLGVNDIDYWEINEAFAAQVLACLRAWTDEQFCQERLGLHAPFGEIDRARLNVDGGGISLGHPVGASGARIVLRLLHVLNDHKAARGVATLCIGGGQGGAMLLECDA